MKNRTEGDKSLSARSAASCENATSPSSACRCRCGGALHGAARGAVRALDPGDPHRPDDEDPKERKRREREEAQAAKLQAMLAAIRSEP